MRELLTAEQTDAIRTMSERLGGATQRSAVEAVVEPESKRPLDRRKRSATKWSEDGPWAQVELRWQDGLALLDLANAMRILERHPDYVGRFSYNGGMKKVFDRGVVMRDWQVDAICAEIQERFLPALPEATFDRALMVAANRNAAAA